MQTQIFILSITCAINRYFVATVIQQTITLNVHFVAILLVKTLTLCVNVVAILSVYNTQFKRLFPSHTHV